MPLRSYLAYSEVEREVTSLLSEKSSVRILFRCLTCSQKELQNDTSDVIQSKTFCFRLDLGHAPPFFPEISDTKHRISNIKYCKIKYQKYRISNIKYCKIKYQKYRMSNIKYCNIKYQNIEFQISNIAKLNLKTSNVKYQILQN